MRNLIPLFLSLFLSAAAIGQNNCLDDFIYLGDYDGHFYYMSTYNAHPSQAYNIANSMGVYLASIGSAGENAWLAPKVGNYKTIGFSDVDSEGNFVWHSGEPVTYTSWWPGEPNNAGNEDYCVINFGAMGRWNDVPDWTSQRFIIEVEGDDDCDGVNNRCDICPSGDDSVDANGDGLPDCAYYPGYEGLSPDWICGNNKVLVCHRPPDNPNNYHTICISKNALADHMSHGDNIGPCQSCNYAFGSAGTLPDRYNALDNESLSLYPNPAGNEVNIVIPQSDENTQIMVFDIQGRMVISQYVNADSGRRITLQTADLGSGIFSVVIRSGATTQTERLVIQR